MTSPPSIIEGQKREFITDFSKGEYDYLNNLQNAQNVESEKLLNVVLDDNDDLREISMREDSFANGANTIDQNEPAQANDLKVSGYINLVSNTKRSKYSKRGSQATKTEQFNTDESMKNMSSEDSYEKIMNIEE